MKIVNLLLFGLSFIVRSIDAVLEDELETAVKPLKDQWEEIPVIEMPAELGDMTAMNPGSLLGGAPQKNIDLEAACEELDSQTIPDGPNYLCQSICGTNRAVFAIRTTVDPFLGAVAGAAEYEYGLIPYYPGRNTFCLQRVNVGSSQANEESCEFLVQQLSSVCEPWCEFGSDFEERRLGEDGAEGNFGVCTLDDYCDTFTATFSGSRTYTCEGDLNGMYSITYSETTETCGGELLDGDGSICFLNTRSSFFNAYTETGLGYKREFTKGVNLVDEFTGQFAEGSTTQLATCTQTVSGNECECTVCNNGQIINGTWEFGSICVINGQTIVRECGSELTYRDVLLLYDTAVNTPPTPPPTVSPSAGPTSSPTGSPTSSPTASPTSSPTSPPTPGPTGAPSTGSATSSPSSGSVTVQSRLRYQLFGATQPTAEDILFVKNQTEVFYNDVIDRNFSFPITVQLETKSVDFNEGFPFQIVYNFDTTVSYENGFLTEADVQEVLQDLDYNGDYLLDLADFNNVWVNVFFVEYQERIDVPTGSPTNVPTMSPTPCDVDSTTVELRNSIFTINSNFTERELTSFEKIQANIAIIGGFNEALSDYFGGFVGFAARAVSTTSDLLANEQVRMDYLGVLEFICAPSLEEIDGVLADPDFIGSVENEVVGYFVFSVPNNPLAGTIDDVSYTYSTSVYV